MCTMSSMVTIKCGEHFYNIPMHEYSRHWLSHLDKISVPHLPNELPRGNNLAASERAAREGDTWD